jgi:opacity protein-like surface antigen
MNKLIVLCLALMLCLPVVSYAASMGGAETQGQGKLGVSLDQEFGFKRDLKFHGSEPAFDPGEEVKEIKTTKMYRTMAKISFGVLDNFDIYGKIGASYSDSKAKFYDNGVDEGTLKYDRTDPAYGFGVKGTYMFQDGWLVGVDAQYLRHDGKIGFKYPGGTQYITSITSEEWQVAPYVAKKMDKFTPYVGGKYSDIRHKLKITRNDVTQWIKFKAKHNFGVFGGIDISMMEHVSLNVEGRFIDETAMSVGLSYRF